MWKGQGRQLEHTHTIGTRDDATPENMEELSDITTPKQHGVAPKGHEDQDNPEDPGDSKENNYLLLNRRIALDPRISPSPRIL